MNTNEQSYALKSFKYVFAAESGGAQTEQLHLGAQKTAPCVSFGQTQQLASDHFWYSESLKLDFYVWAELDWKAALEGVSEAVSA